MEFEMRNIVLELAESVPSEARARVSKFLMMIAQKHGCLSREALNLKAQDWSRHLTHFAVDLAKRSGALVVQPCERCVENPDGRQMRGKILAHHDDYNFPLAVRWLCNFHHMQWHSINHAVQLRHDLWGFSGHRYYKLGLAQMIDSSVSNANVSPRSRNSLESPNAPCLQFI